VDESSVSFLRRPLSDHTGKLRQQKFSILFCWLFTALASDKNIFLSHGHHYKNMRTLQKDATKARHGDRITKPWRPAGISQAFFARGHFAWLTPVVLCRKKIYI